jgi:uncharacterized damage-inducible protein DinB
MKRIPKPLPAEYAVYYGQYIDAVPENTNILDGLKLFAKETEQRLLLLSEEQLLHRYAADKWSIKDIMLHVVDCERIFLYRALRFSRNDKMALPFFDENEFAKEANADSLPIKKILKEYKTQRAATIAFLANQSTKVLKRTGIASQAAMSVRACAWIIYAHERHHWKVIEEKYLNRH